MPMRRFGSRWRDVTTPVEVLDIFRFTNGQYEVLIRNGTTDGKDEWADGLEIDSEGRWSSFELDRWQARLYRARQSWRRCSWAALPAPVRTSVAQWLED